jgi:hypothetical protein
MMTRPTIEQIKERKRRLEEALSARALGTFKACLLEVDTADLEAVRRGINPGGRKGKLFIEAIDKELERREDLQK